MICIFIASSSHHHLHQPTTVTELKRVFMADACHVHFGNYTLFSCYGVTANGNMSPVRFAIVLGNENGTTWEEFWIFVKGVHLLLNLLDVTIVTNQDKGQKSAIKDVMDQASHFHCAHHRRGNRNIIKMCGSESSSHIYSVLWVYNCLVGCQTVEAIERKKNTSMEMMHIKDVQYLNSLEDEEQYPAMRCNKGPRIYMYHRSTSAAVESMNAANRKMHAKSAVDTLNACILLMKFNSNAKDSWHSVLRPGQVVVF